MHPSNKLNDGYLERYKKTSNVLNEAGFKIPAAMSKLHKQPLHWRILVPGTILYSSLSDRRGTTNELQTRGGDQIQHTLSRTKEFPSENHVRLPKTCKKKKGRTTRTLLIKRNGYSSGRAVV